MSTKPQTHNRFKLPFYLVCFMSGAALTIGGVVGGGPALVVSGVVVAAISVPPLWMIVRRRGNPWWMRAPIDPSSTDESATAEPFERGRYVFVLVASIGFVLTGAALIAYGAVAKRWDFVFVGAASVLFFGFCASVGVAILRGSV